MRTERVILHGVAMAKGWPERIETAQALSSYTLNGRTRPRIRYGDENPTWGSAPCRDCGVIKGQFHVPDCEYESCPFCMNAFAGGCTCAIAELQAEAPVRGLGRGTLQRALDGFERVSIRVILFGLALAFFAFIVWLWRQGLFWR